MRRRLGWLGAACCLLPAAALAQPAACPAPHELGQRQLLGLWRAQLDGAPAATLLLEPHPEYSEGVRGAVNRSGVRAAVSGDVDEGEFTLEESADGQRISATWLGEVVEGSCGREIRGTWRSGSDEATRPFVLRKLD